MPGALAPDVGPALMRREVRREVLARAGRYRTIREDLRVKEVSVEGRRYVVCLNPEEAEKPKVRSRCSSARNTWDRADREAILASLEDALRKGAKALVGDKGYRRYLKGKRGAFEIDGAKTKDEARYDGKYVLRTNLALDAGEIALKYRQLRRVERAFRTVKSVLEARPVYHTRDETIMGHVFCSFRGARGDA